MQDFAVRQSFELDRDCDTFLQWSGLFEQRLAKAGLCTIEDCVSQLPGLAGQLTPVPVALLEFDEVYPLAAAALDALASWQQHVSPRRPTGQPLSHACTDKRVELQTVAAWAATVHRTLPTATIGIVLSDMAGDRVAMEYLLRREFNCLGRNYNSLPVNFSTGIPLARAPLVRDALALLSLGLEHTNVRSVVGLLHSRFTDLQGLHGPLAQRLVRQVYAEGREELPVAQLRIFALSTGQDHDSAMDLGRRLLAMSRMGDLRRAAPASAWALRFSSVLTLFGWPGNRGLDSLEFQQLSMWQRCLDLFRAYDAVCGVLDYNEALRLLRDTCNGQTFQPRTTDSPIQVLGPLEAAGLTFDHLWLCGMQAGDWPAAPRPHPFIPVTLQAQLHMPHASAEREWHYGENLLQHYLRSCSSLHASYCRQRDGIPDLPSPLLADFVASPLPAPPLVAPQWLDRLATRTHEEIPDHQAPAIGRGDLATFPGGSGVLEDQSQCPFRAFARYRLCVDPLEELGPGFPGAERGSALHAALFELWGDIGDLASLQTMDEACEQGVIVRAVATALEKIPKGQRRKLGGAYWQLEGQRLTGLLREWLAVERQRSVFAVVAREQALELDLCGLQLSLRIDRVDQLPDGAYVIMDYKSGSCSVQDLLGDRPAKPQLLLYASAWPINATALVFAQVRPGDCRLVGLGSTAVADGVMTDIPKAVKSRMNVLDWDSLHEIWHRTVERLAREFMGGQAQVDPLGSSSCNGCGLQPLCRIDIPSGPWSGP
ncbi:MAG: PD-(D/E)XK nuclease family protein [Halioglobus sp.]